MLAAMRLALVSLVLALPLGSCTSVMAAYGDHVIYADGHPWHTWPARFGVAVFATVTPIVLSPLLGLELLVGEKLGYGDACTSTSLAAGVVLGTPTWVLGLPFERGDEEPAPVPAPAEPSPAENR